MRLYWIRAELALSLDEPGVALGHAELAVAKSGEAGATRHEVKSQLVRVVGHLSRAGGVKQPQDEDPKTRNLIACRPGQLASWVRRSA